MTLIDFVAWTPAELLPTERVCPRCRMAKHEAAFVFGEVTNGQAIAWCADCGEDVRVSA